MKKSERLEILQLYLYNEMLMSEQYEGALYAKDFDTETYDTLGRNNDIIKYNFDQKEGEGAFDEYKRTVVVDEDYVPTYSSMEPMYVDIYTANVNIPLLLDDNGMIIGKL